MTMFVIRQVVRNIIRHSSMGAILLLVTACISLFLCLYIGNIQENEMHLARLADTMTVSGCITNADGSQDIALIIPLKRLDAIRSSSATDRKSVV